MLTDTFNLVARRFADLAVIVIVAAAIAVPMVALFMTASHTLISELVESPEAEHLADLASTGADADAVVEALETWRDSIDGD